MVASSTGLGAVLSQLGDDGTEHVVTYGSRFLSKPKRQYCVIRQELLAVVEFLQHFCPYLLRRKFQLRTDYGSLTWLKNFREPKGKWRDGWRSSRSLTSLSSTAQVRCILTVMLFPTLKILLQTKKTSEKPDRPGELSAPLH